MKFGFRVPSLKKRIAARTSLKRVVRHSLGVKAPKGMGFLTNPKKALYNKVYNKTTIGVDQLLKPSAKTQTIYQGELNIIKPKAKLTLGRTLLYIIGFMVMVYLLGNSPLLFFLVLLVFAYFKFKNKG